MQPITDTIKPTESDTGANVVRGRVIGARRGQFVRAYDRDFRSEELLGQSEIGARGSYAIRYGAGQFARAEKGGADLRVAVCEPGGRELVSSAIYFNAGTEATIDLVVAGVQHERSEYERHLADLELVLQGTALSHIDGESTAARDADLDFLSGDTGVDRQHVAWLVRAAAMERMAKGSDTTPSLVAASHMYAPLRQSSAIPSQAFYGWFRQGLPTQWEELVARPVSELRAALSRSIDQNIVDASLRDDIESIVASVPNPAVVELARVVETAGLPAEVSRVIATRADGIDTLSDDVLTQLVDAKALAPEQAETVGLNVSLHALAGGDRALVMTMLASEFPSAAGRLTQARDLARLDPADWERSLATSRSPIPDGLSRTAYARRLAMDAVDAFPTLAFTHRATRLPDAIGDAELADYANRHPGLGIHEVLADAKDPEAAMKIIRERAAWLQTVIDANTEVDFLNLDYLPGTADMASLKFVDLPKEAREAVMRDLRASQRVFAVTGNVIAMQEHLAAGYDSASAMARSTPKELAEKVGITRDEAEATHAIALDSANEAAANWFRLHDLARDQATTPVRAIPSRSEFFKPLTGFQDLLVNQAWCDCDDCHSVLSPAAYFVDLMYYVEQNILGESFKGKANHPLHLKVRRPDLWELPLSCANTNDVVPTLDIANAVLERYLRDTLHLANTADLYAMLADQEGSFRQPFTLSIERLETLLKHFALSRHDIGKAMQVDDALSVRARLQLSRKAYDLVTSARTGANAFAFFTQLYGLTGIGAPATQDTVLKPMEVQPLLRATGLTHDLLQSVLATMWVNADGSANAAIAIALGKRDPQDVQNNTELVTGLTLNRLDRIHRFVRLWRTLPWTIDELDYVVGRLTALGVAAGIDADALTFIVRLLELAPSWNLPVAELMALVDTFPDQRKGEKQSMVDRLFNQPAFLARDQPWPPAAPVTFTHPSWASNGGQSTPSDNSLARLLAGLQISDGELLALVASLSAVPAMGYAAAAPPVDEHITLSAASLGILYRHARLMRLLKYSAADFVRVTALVPRLAGRPADTRYIQDLSDVASIVAFARWQRDSGFSLDEISYVVGGARPDAFTDPAALAADVVARVASERSLTFADTLFTQIGLTDIESRAVVAANAGTTDAGNTAFRILPDGATYRLSANFDVATPLTIPASVTTAPTAAAVTALLGTYEALRVFDATVGNGIGLSASDAKALGVLARLNAAAEIDVIQQALFTGNSAPLVPLLDILLRYRALFKGDEWLIEGRVSKKSGLRFAQEHRGLLALPDDPNAPTDRTISTKTVRAVSAYVKLAAQGDPSFGATAGPANIDALQAVLPGVAGASDADLAAALRVDPTRIGALKPHLIALPANPFDALDILARCLALAEQLGVSGETLSLMVQEVITAGVFDAAATFKALSRAAEDVFGAFRAKYADAATFDEKMGPFEDAIRGRKRDALVDFVTRKWPVPFSDANKLYEYFLIDVLVEGCARTSPLVSATSSVQLYVQRVLMSLERSDDWNGSIPPAVGAYAYFDDSRARDEWYWRQHYRVWEANRKVFLYPENYIEPELRDDKTPIYRELEDTLLQQELSDANAEAAFAAYLAGFDEAARLKIAGAYHDVAGFTLHLFGVTPTLPPTMYYRSIVARPGEQQQASAWAKLSINIPVRKVSPIVFEGRLYVFWMETTTRPMNGFEGGNSRFTGYRHAIRVKYVTLRSDSHWTAPQSLQFADGDTTEESRIVTDPRSGEADKTALVNRRDELDSAIAARKPAVDDANNQIGAANAARDYAQLHLNDPPTAGEANEAEAVKQIAKAAYDIASAASSFFGGNAAANDAAGSDAALFAMAPAVFAQDFNPLTAVGQLNDAGVSWTDAVYLARRKVTLNTLAFLADLMVTTYQQTIDAQKRDEAERAQVQQAIDNAVILVRWDKRKRDHTDPLDNYKPEGWEWDRPYPSIYTPYANAEVGSLYLTIVPSDTESVAAAPPLEVDFADNVLRGRTSAPDASVNDLIGAPQPNGSVALQPFTDQAPPNQLFYAASKRLLGRVGGSANTVAQAAPEADVQIVNGATDSAIVETRGDVVWLRKASGTPPYSATRLGTTLTLTLRKQFSQRGRVADLLDAAFQKDLAKLPPKAPTPAGRAELNMAENPFAPTNPYLTYYRETFFHIAFGVASHLNGDEQFEAAQRWYHYIFNPTADDGARWRYRELRDLPGQTLRAMLTDPASLAAYRTNPFNPHAIARTRLSAYQKSIVMKYIDNLLDWGDSLFTQFTMESVNEATMLYVMAQDILGPRPPVLSSCGEKKATPTYQFIRDNVLKGKINDFLVELEPPPSKHGHAGKKEGEKRIIESRRPREKSGGGEPMVTRSLMIVDGGHTPQGDGGSYWTSTGGRTLDTVYASAGAGRSAPAMLGTGPGAPALPPSTTRNIDFIEPTGSHAPVGVPGGNQVVLGGKLPMLDIKYTMRDVAQREPIGKKPPIERPPRPHPVDLVPPKDAVFCIPPNRDLLAYWDRVEERLFKIRNCLDISGVKRELALFAPEIDPRLLVRMQAAGLTLDDVLNSSSGNVPPYRFLYLIDKAKQYAGTVQSFGSQLLGAIEKRDAEELGQLRAVHEQNLLSLRARLAQMEIDAAEDTLAGLQRQKEAAEYRQEHFRSLLEAGSLPAERTQQQLQHEASTFRTMASVTQFVAAVLSIIPDAGAPTAMKFGGSQLGAAGRAAAEGLNALGAFNEMAAQAAGVEAGGKRRDQEWAHQMESAKRDVAQIDKQITAAEIRRDIAVRSQTIHQTTIDQAEEAFTFLRDKFTSAERYGLLVKRMRGLHRVAFNGALSMARMAEQAFSVERTDDDTRLGGSYWDADNIGLLAGERLLNDLQGLERRFIETNYRQLEVEQSFSLAQFAPDALVKLQQDGSCAFTVPEAFFDLTYPGQYRRRLKAVRLSVPCVTGPYTNVGATLNLVSSAIRLKPLPAPVVPAVPIPAPVSVPRRHTVSMATSKAQYDAGVFDFSFRDERYMPFEGSGAISSWELSLPETIRVFDYGTITDVVLHLSYTSDFDGTHKQALEARATGLLEMLRAPSALSASFSLREDFPEVWYRLATSPVGTEIEFAIEQRHLPFFLAGRALRVDAASAMILSPLTTLVGATTTKVAIRPKVQTAAPLGFRELTAPGAATVTFAGPGMRTFDLGTLIDAQPVAPPGLPAGIAPTFVASHLIKLVTAGPLAPAAPGPDGRVMDAEKVRDIIIEVRYGIA